MVSSLTETDTAVLRILRDGRARTLDEIGALYDGVLGGLAGEGASVIGRARATQLGRDGYVLLDGRRFGSQTDVYKIAPVARERLHDLSPGTS